MMISFICIDLFVGVGGFSFGLKMVGWRILVVFDYDVVVCVIYRCNFDGVEVFEDDIWGVSWKCF